MKTEIDYLIVGAGLAGSCLAWELIQSGEEVVLTDVHLEGASSLVSAGIINPITGKRYVKTWNWDVLETDFTHFYQRAEAFFRMKLLHQRKIYQILDTIEEENQWLSRMMQQEYAEFLNWSKHSFDLCPNLQAGQSLGIIERAYQLDISKLLNLLRHFFKSLNVIREKVFNYQEITREDLHWMYQDLWIKKGIIFAEGYRIFENPFFNWLPSFAVKGQRILFEAVRSTQDLLKSEYTIASTSDENIFWCGSNYEFQNTNPQVDPGEERRQQLFIQNQVDGEFKFLNSQCGIRPAMKDRRPIIGEHPHLKGLFVMNGLGTKGSSLTPYVVNHMIRFLKGTASIDKEMNISRFYHLKDKL